MPHILVIDDDRHMRTACTRVLEMSGWSASGAATGAEGIEQIRSGAVKTDLVLLDQLMPGMSGVEALAQICSVQPTLPVVIMTGFITEESAADLKSRGAFDCLVKPFTPDQLRAIIRRALDESGGTNPA